MTMIVTGRFAAPHIIPIFQNESTSNNAAANADKDPAPMYMAELFKDITVPLDYSGIFFLMMGEALSHAFANDYGDYGFHIILPLVYAALGIASWALRQKSRRL